MCAHSELVANNKLGLNVPNANQQSESDRHESVVRRIVGCYVDSTEDYEMDFLLLCLDGGKIPADTAETLRPIMETLVDQESNSANAPTRQALDALEQLRVDIESLYEAKAATRKVLKSAIYSQRWAKSERALAARFGLELLPACDRTLDLLA